jgi:hypothetical protein
MTLRLGGLKVASGSSLTFLRSSLNKCSFVANLRVPPHGVGTPTCMTPLHLSTGGSVVASTFGP